MMQKILLSLDNKARIILMRWNGKNEEDNGYPVGRANTPLWFRTQEKLTKPILIMLLAQEKADMNKILEILKNHNQ